MQRYCIEKRFKDTFFQLCQTSGNPKSLFFFFPIDSFRHNFLGGFSSKNELTPSYLSNCGKKLGIFRDYFLRASFGKTSLNLL